MARVSTARAAARPAVPAAACTAAARSGRAPARWQPTTALLLLLRETLPRAPRASSRREAWLRLCTEARAEAALSAVGSRGPPARCSRAIGRESFASVLEALLHAIAQQRWARPRGRTRRATSPCGSKD
eukprot:scaffold83937_cov66-Phaeocystis_antarctica.AAC.6